MNSVKTLPKLMIFAQVAKHASFTQAASVLGISKSAVSQHIAQLESSLGTHLVSRTTRGVTLTPLGEQLYLRCSRLQEQVNLLFTDIEQAQQNPQGRFRLTYPHALEATIILPALNQLCTEYPGLQPELIASDHNQDIIQQDIDLAVRASQLHDSSHRALMVGQITERFCASPTYLNQAGTPKTLTDLQHHRWIATAWQSSKLTLCQHTDSDPVEHTVTLSHFARTNAISSAVAMTLDHLGISLLPDCVAQPLLQSGKLAHILPQVSSYPWPVYTLHAYSKTPIHIQRYQQLLQCFFDYK